MFQRFLLARLIYKLPKIKGERSINTIVAIGKLLGLPFDYVFEHKQSGPVSITLNEDLNFLETIGLLCIQIEGNIPIYSYNSKKKLKKYWDKYAFYYQSQEIIEETFEYLTTFVSKLTFNPIMLNKLYFDLQNKLGFFNSLFKIKIPNQ